MRVGGCVLSFVSRLLRSAFSNLASAELDPANMLRENVLWIQVIKVFFSFEILYLKICDVLYARLLNNPTNGASAKPPG